MIFTGRHEKVGVVVGAISFLQEWILEALEESKYITVLSSSDNGLECLSAVARLQPDLVILGPGLRELDVVRTIRQIKREDQAPKCLVLGQFVLHLPEQAVLAGADCCIIVPCTKRELLRHIEKLVPALTHV